MEPIQLNFSQKEGLSVSTMVQFFNEKNITNAWMIIHADLDIQKEWFSIAALYKGMVTNGTATTLGYITRKTGGNMWYNSWWKCKGTPSEKNCFYSFAPFFSRAFFQDWERKVPYPTCRKTSFGNTFFLLTRKKVKIRRKSWWVRFSSALLCTLSN